MIIAVSCVHKENCKQTRNAELEIWVVIADWDFFCVGGNYIGQLSYLFKYTGLTSHYQGYSSSCHCLPSQLAFDKNRPVQHCDDKTCIICSERLGFGLCYRPVKNTSSLSCQASIIALEILQMRLWDRGLRKAVGASCTENIQLNTWAMVAAVM